MIVVTVDVARMRTDRPVLVRLAAAVVPAPEPTGSRTLEERAARARSDCTLAEYVGVQ